MRNGIRRVIAALVIFVAFGGGADALFETRDAKLQAVKTVGIISAIGDQFTLAKGGLTGPDDGSRNFSIAAWGLDDLIVRQVTAALSGRFQVQPVTYQRAAFTDIKESAIAPVNLVRGDPFKKLVESEVSPQGLDAYIVITKAKANFGGGNRRLEGVGLITFKTLMDSYSQVYALYEIRVVDGKSFDIIEKMAAAPVENAGYLRLAGPNRLLEDGFPIGTDARDETLHRLVSDLIADSLPITLGNMHLVVSP
jgi:hypothetical protein